MWWEVIVGDEVAIISKETFNYSYFLGQPVVAPSFSFSSPIKQHHKITYVSPLDSQTDTRFWTWDSDVVHSCEAAILKPGFVLPEIYVEALICEFKTPGSSVASKSERGTASPKLHPDRSDEPNCSVISESMQHSDLNIASAQIGGDLPLRVVGNCLCKRDGAVLDAYVRVKAYVRLVLNGLFLHEIGSSAVDMENGLYIPSYDTLTVCSDELHSSVILRFVTAMTADGDADAELEGTGARWIGRPEGNLFRVLRPLVQSQASAAEANFSTAEMRLGRGHNRIIVSSSALDSPLGSFDDYDHANFGGSEDSEGLEVFHERPVAAAARNAAASARGTVEIELHCDGKRERDTLYLALLGLLPRSIQTSSSCASAAMTLRQRLKLMPWNAGDGSAAQQGSPSRFSRNFSISKSESEDSQHRLSLSSDSRSAELTILPLSEISARKMRSVSEGELTLAATATAASLNPSPGDGRTATRSRLGSVFFNRNNSVSSPNSRRLSMSVQDTAGWDSMGTIQDDGVQKADGTLLDESRDNKPAAAQGPSEAAASSEPCIVALPGLKDDFESLGDMKVSVVAQTDKMVVRSRRGSIFYSGNSAISQPGRQRKSIAVVQSEEPSANSV